MAKDTVFNHPPKGHIAALIYDSANDRWVALSGSADGNLKIGYYADGPYYHPLATDGAGHLLIAYDSVTPAWRPFNVDTAGRLQVGLYTAGETWHAPAVDGDRHLQVDVLSEPVPTVYLEHEEDLSASSGENTLTFSTVPGGEVWVIETFSAWSNDSGMGRIDFILSETAGDRRIYAQETPGVDVTANVPTRLYLSAGDCLKVVFNSCTATAEIYANANGYKLT